MPKNIVICGGREFDDYDFLCRALDYLFEYRQIKIVCGMARGADMLGRKWALDRGHEVLEFPADWNTHGKKAGFIRNREMADVADRVVAFWDGESRGTLDMIDVAVSKSIRTMLIGYGDMRGAMVEIGTGERKKSLTKEQIASLFKLFKK